MQGWKILLEESGIWNKFACGKRNPGLWNPESHQQLEPEIQVPILKKWRIQYLESENPRPGIQNPRPSWIPLHGVTPKSELQIHLEIHLEILTW